MKEFFKMFFASLLGVLTACIIFSAIMVFVMASMFANMVISATSPSQPIIEKNSILEINIAALPEISGDDPMAIFTGKRSATITLTDAVKAVEHAKENDKIKGIYLNTSGIASGVASVEVLRNSIEDFKSSGKFVIAYSDSYSQKAYYLASVADKVYVNPLGSVAVVGVSSTTTFYKDLLKKLGVEMMVFKVGKFKGAVEPFTNDKLSEENRLQIEQYTGGVWTSLKDGIASARSISTDAVQAYADEGGAYVKSEMAVEFGLVDSLAYRSDVEDILRARIDQEPKDDLRTISIAALAKTLTNKSKKGDAVKVIYAEGSIQEESSSVYSSNNVISEQLAKKIRLAAQDNDVKAVVLRVNSGGGSAFISDVIWKEVKELKKKKPIVVSMGDMAASGGYYISCASSYIFAEPNTLTGSIGIFGMFPNSSELAKKIGLKSETVETAKYAALGTRVGISASPLTEDEKALIQSSVNIGYQTFLSRVADGRNMTIDQVDSVAQGRVWLGAKALELGLVDGLGSLNNAIDKAVELAQLGSDYRVWYEKPSSTSFLNRVLSGVPMQMRQIFTKDIFTEEEMEVVAGMRQAREMGGIQARLPMWFQPY